MDEKTEPSQDSARPDVDDAARRSVIRTLFDRRARGSGTAPRGTMWSRRVSNAKAASIIIGAVASAFAILIGAVRHAGAEGREGTARVDSALVALDGRTTSLERFRDTLSVFRANWERQQDSIRSDQRMTNYMLCVLIRRSDQTAVPPGCDPVTTARRR